MIRSASVSTTTAQHGELTPPRLQIEDGTVEGLKWLALVLMTFDHINKYLLSDRVYALFAAGRVAMPLFAFVLAYNFARPGVAEGGAPRRALTRLIAFGALASVPFIGLGGLAWGWWPVNIMGMLALAVAIMKLLTQRSAWARAAAVFLFVVGGAFVEFWWPGLAICLAAWSYCKRPSWAALVLWVGSTAALYVVNKNLWALAALVVVFAAPHLRLRIPRLRTLFYAYYPLHLAALWCVARLLV
jgi:hypothetical protein